MRSLWLICLAWLGMGWSGLAAEPARVRLFCLSVRVEPGEANLFGLEYRMTFSSANFSAPNSEVYPIFEDDLSHASGFLMEAPDFPEPLQGDIGLNVPESADANTNGIPDFYEVAAGLPSTSTDGLWASEVSSGTCAACGSGSPGSAEER